MKTRIGLGGGVAALVAGLLLWQSPARGGDGEGTVAGQVIDTSCYLAQGLHGDGHRQCAEICGRDKGIALALVDDKGQVWHLVDSAMPGNDQNSKVLPYAEQFVKATGTLIEKGPNRAIIIKKVDLVKGTANPQAVEKGAANPCAAKQAEAEHGPTRPGDAKPGADANPCAKKP